MTKKNPARSSKKSVKNKRCEKSCDRLDCPKKPKAKTTKAKKVTEAPVVQNVATESVWQKIKNFFC